MSPQVATMMMEATTSSRQCDIDIVYLQGTFHQGNESQFKDFSRGHQCVPDSIASIALSQICSIQ